MIILLQCTNNFVCAVVFVLDLCLVNVTECICIVLGASMTRGGVTGPPAMGQSRLKQEGGVWGHGRNGSWDETGPGGWDDATPWTKQKAMGTPIWDEMDWNSKHGPKPQLTKEMVWNSKQFRQLVDMGYKVIMDEYGVVCELNGCVCFF